jgi:hypothetical protein
MRRSENLATSLKFLSKERILPFIPIDFFALYEKTFPVLEGTRRLARSVSAA